MVVDYFPQYMIENFEMTYIDGIDTSNVSSQIDTETNSITWNLAKLLPGETAIIQYKLKLKDEFDEAIIDKVLDTNEKVDISYKDFDGTDETETSDVTPKIKLARIPVDNTIAPEPIPKAGSPMFIAVGIAILAVAVYCGYKFKKVL